MKTITLEHIEKAIIDISHGQTKHGKATKYNQRVACGTACCIAGHANQIAGNKMPGALADDSQFFFDLVTRMGNEDRYQKQLAKLLDDGTSKIGSFVELMKRAGRWKKSYDVKPKGKKIKGGS